MGISLGNPSIATRLCISVEKFGGKVLIAGFLILIVPLLSFDIVRLTFLTPLNYNEGWNALHTLRLLRGEPLYLPLSELPVTPVNYPPLSFLIVGFLNPLTGDLLLTGRLVSVSALLVVGFLIFRIVYNLTGSRQASLLGALLWVAVMVLHAPHYVGVYDPQILGHVFSVGALALYAANPDRMSYSRAFTLALLCSVALFVKHLLVVVPLTLGIVLLLSSRKAFLTFAGSGIGICTLLLLVARYYFGDDFYSNLIEMDRSSSWAKMVGDVALLFFGRGCFVLFLPFLILSLRVRRLWFWTFVYGFVGFSIGIFAVRGDGVAVNAWFDFFIAASIVFGLCASMCLESGKVLAANDLVGILARPYFSTRVVLVGVVGCIAFAEVLFAFFVDSAGSHGRWIGWGLRFFELMLLLNGVGFLWLREGNGPRLRMVAYANLAAVLLLIGAKVEWIFSDYQQLVQKERHYLNDVTFLKSVPGLALFDQLLLGYAAGKKFWFDPFAGAQLIMSGRINEDSITKPIENQYFKVIVLQFELEKGLERIRKTRRSTNRSKTLARWTDATLEAIERHYEPLPVNGMGLHYFYVPRKLVKTEIDGQRQVRVTQ